MIRAIMKDIAFLEQVGEEVTKDDLYLAQDLLDTIKANAKGCVGMAANMIGINKRMIVFDEEGVYTIMINPEIIKCSNRYETQEACLSLSGTRDTARYQSIKVKYQTIKFQTRIKTYTGFTAQIIQHEIDHCNGIII